MSMDNRRGPSPSGPNQQKNAPNGFRFSMIWVVLLVAVIVGNIIFSQLAQPSDGNRVSISWSQFLQQVQSNHVASVTTQSDVFDGVFKPAQNVEGTDGKPHALVTTFATR